MSSINVRFTDADLAQRAAWWRSVLGEYPTGVAIISALDAQGDAQGMVVGTFSSVSLDPPLISYMPMRSSRSYTAIRDAKRFRVSVLGSGHEELCRAFATAPPESRFSVGAWEQDTHGIPHLVDCVVWFDCKRTHTVEAGDHDIVMGQVEDLGFGNGDAGMPLLFLKGGYGSFTVPRLDFDAQGLGSHLRLADEARNQVQDLAEELGAVATLGTVTKNTVVILSAANVRARKSLVGATYPFAAPLSPVLAAWGGAEREAAWRDAGRTLGFVQDELLDTMLARVRDRGYAVSIGTTRAQRFERLVGTQRWDPDETTRLWAEITKDAELGDAEDWASYVTSIQVPVFDASGSAALSLAVISLPLGMTLKELEFVVHRAKAVAKTISGTM